MIRGVVSKFQVKRTRYHEEFDSFRRRETLSPAFLMLVAPIVRTLLVRCLVVVFGFFSVISCEVNDSVNTVFTELRIYENPYRNVDWMGDVRLKAQHHDHVGGRPGRVIAYDAAGYDVLSLMDYSGNPEHPHAWSERMWPPENWVAPSVLTRLASIQFFIPNAEEVGLSWHVTSPFLTTYIEVATPRTARASWQYENSAQLVSRIREFDGIPCVAHPWAFPYESLLESTCTEIYTAYAEAKKQEGVSAFVDQDRNGLMLSSWDRALEHDQRVLGIAVNDHYGPYLPAGVVSENIKDSGKIVVFAKAPTPGAYRESFEAGAFIAVKDLGEIKDRFPDISSINQSAASIDIETMGKVSWISAGSVVGVGSILNYADIPANSRYVRAEIEGEDGSVVYTQAFVVRPVGDVDGDYDVDEFDRQICVSVEHGFVSETTLVEACEASSW